MGRKKRNSSLVQELINGRWTMDQEEFENKYNSLSLDDMCEGYHETRNYSRVIQNFCGAVN